MKKEKIEKMLDELGQATAEPVRPALADEIKSHMPGSISRHRSSLDTVNIIIDLRVNKLAAAAVIIITMILLATFLGGLNVSSGTFFQDSAMLVKYYLTGQPETKTFPDISIFYTKCLDQNGQKLVYYGDVISPGDSEAILVQWKLPDGHYYITFGDLHTNILSAERLIEVQANMLEKKPKDQ